MTTIGIVGASGYTGAELVRLLHGHPNARVTAITSRAYAGKPLGACFPHLGGLDLIFTNHKDPGVFDQADVWFTALPHQTSMNVVSQLVNEGHRTVDLSADFRFADPAVYEAHYGPHSCPGLLDEAVYGLTEIHGAAVEQCRVVGNPGCYPTSVLLPLIPLLEEGLIRPEEIIADSKSGVTGAGRTPGPGTHYCEVNGGFKAYKVGAHRHEPEIRSQLELAAGCEVSVAFTPHLVPMARGILSTVYVTPRNGTDVSRVQATWRNHYGNSPFIRILDDDLPSTAYVRGTNECWMAVKSHPSVKKLIIVSAIDNLVKGASGQAVQNLNRMMGWNEQAGLGGRALYP